MRLPVPSNLLGEGRGFQVAVRRPARGDEDCRSTICNSINKKRPAPTEQALSVLAAYFPFLPLTTPTPVQKSQPLAPK